MSPPCEVTSWRQQLQPRHCKGCVKNDNPPLSIVSAMHGRHDPEACLQYHFSEYTFPRLLYHLPCCSLISAEKHSVWNA